MMARKKKYENRHEIKHGKWVWINMRDETKKSKSKPDKLLCWGALPPMSRVHGSTYTPYEDDGTEWAKDANNQLERWANYNKSSGQ